MSDIICARDYVADCQCDECIQKRDASAKAPNALPGIISQILRENAQLNTQVTELQQRGTELVEENRVLKAKLLSAEEVILRCVPDDDTVCADHE